MKSLSKTTMTFVALLLAVSAQANTTESMFQRKSALPSELQSMVLEYLQTHCSEYVIPYGLYEMGTTVETVRDTEVRKLHYSTEINAHYYPDGMHPGLARIFVQSSQTSVFDSNPRYDIERVSVDGSDCK